MDGEWCKDAFWTPGAVYTVTFLDHCDNRAPVVAHACGWLMAVAEDSICLRTWRYDDEALEPAGVTWYGIVRQAITSATRLEAAGEHTHRNLGRRARR